MSRRIARPSIQVGIEDVIISGSQIDIYVGDPVDVESATCTRGAEGGEPLSIRAIFSVQADESGDHAFARYSNDTFESS